MVTEGVTMVEEAKDYTGKTIKPGDLARSIESGWLGRIDEMTSEEVKIDDERSYTEVMCKMTGVYELGMVIDGWSVEKAISPDDVQWFAANDLRRVEVK